MKFIDIISIRWADLDPNFHVRHSAYYDWGAQQRIDALNQLGLTMDVMKELHIGPILFREECIYRREIRMGDTITIALNMTALNEDGSRWSMQHVLTNQLGELCATINIDGAWIDTVKRKLANPLPDIAVKVMQQIPVLAD